MHAKCVGCWLGFFCSRGRFADVFPEVLHDMPLTRALSRVPEGPQCALPFGAPSVLNGGVFCEAVSGQAAGVQQCRLVCRQGFRSASASTSFQCDAQQRRWVSAAPLYQACQSMSEPRGPGRARGDVRRCTNPSSPGEAAVSVTVMGHNGCTGAAILTGIRLVPPGALLISVSWRAPVPDADLCPCNSTAINSCSTYMQICLC